MSVTVEVVGVGLEEKELVRVAVDERELVFARRVGAGDAEVRVSHRDVFAFTGHVSMHKWSELVHTHADEGFITPVRITPPQGENGRGRPAAIYLLARWEVWYLIGKSRTREGNEFAARLAKAFDLAVRTLLAQRDELVLLRARVASLEVFEQSAELGVVGAEWARLRITPRINHAAMLRCQAEPTRRYRSHLRTVTTHVRNAVHWTGKGESWANYPKNSERVSALLKALDVELASAALLVRDAKRVAVPAQLTFFDGALTGRTS